MAGRRRIWPLALLRGDDDGPDFDPLVGDARIAAPGIERRSAPQRRSEHEHQCADRYSLAGKHFLLRRHGVPQVHIVAYCGDLGYGVARGAEMLALMLAFGIVSRIGSGFVADRLGGLSTLLIGSIAQGLALAMYLFFDGMTSLYVVSALFGLFRRALPSYAIIVRETMPAREAATRVAIVIGASVGGMSFGGWISGVIFRMTGSYRTAFLNGMAWNALNIGIVLMLLDAFPSRPRLRLKLTEGG